MKLSPVFARYEPEMIGACLDTDGLRRMVLVTRGFEDDAHSNVWDTNATVFFCRPDATRHPIRLDAQRVIEISLSTFVIDERYSVRVGWSDHDGKLYIVSDGVMERLTKPPKSPTI